VGYHSFANSETAADWHCAVQPSLTCAMRKWTHRFGQKH